MITLSRIIIFILLIILIQLGIEYYFKKPLNIQSIYNFYPTMLLFGILGFILIDLSKDKVKNILKNSNLKLSVSSIRILSLMIHLSLIVIPTYILYTSRIDKKHIHYNNYRYIIPIVMIIFYKLLIYPDKISSLYVL